MMKKKKTSLKKIDSIVTGVIVWGVIASVYGLKKKKEKDPMKKKGRQRFGIFRKIISILKRKWEK